MSEDERGAVFGCFMALLVVTALVAVILYTIFTSDPAQGAEAVVLGLL